MPGSVSRKTGDANEVSVSSTSAERPPTSVSCTSTEQSTTQVSCTSAEQTRSLVSSTSAEQSLSSDLCTSAKQNIRQEHSLETHIGNIFSMDMMPDRGAIPSGQHTRESDLKVSILAKDLSLPRHHPEGLHAVKL